MPDKNDIEKKKIKKAKIAKRRRMEDMKASAISVLLLFAFVLLIALILIFVPRSKISNVEKRSLAQFPVFTFADYFSGDFTSGITEFYDDTVPLRDSFKNAGNNIKTAFGIHPKTQAEFVGVSAKADEPETTEPATQKQTEANVETEETTTDDVNKRDYDLEVADATLDEGVLVVYQDGHYRGVSLAGDVDGDLYAETANYMRETLDKKINIYFMPIPVSCEYYVPSNYSEYFSDLGSTFKKIYNEMDKDIKYVDIVETLRNHNEEAIYLRTDHHWAPLGAYYAAREFTKAAGVPFADLEKDYDEVVKEGYVGTLYAFSGNANLLNDPEDFVYYIAKNKYIVDYYDENFEYIYTGDLYQETDVENSYLAFYKGDDVIIRMTTDVKNGRKLLIVKDSYGNAEVPFYAQSFEEVYVVDQRYCKINLINFINQMEVTDVLLTNNVYCLTGVEAELLNNIVMGYTDVAIIDKAPPAKLPGDEDETSSKDGEDDTNNATDVSEDESTDGVYDEYAQQDAAYEVEEY